MRCPKCHEDLVEIIMGKVFKCRNNCNIDETKMNKPLGILTPKGKFDMRAVAGNVIRKSRR